jgi:two-component system sensor histidine kinase DesK
VSVGRVVGRVGGLLATAVWLFPLASPLSTARSLTAVVGLATFAVVYTFVTWASFESVGRRKVRLAGFCVVALLGLALAVAYGPEWLMVLLYVGSCATSVWAPAARPTVLGVVGTETAVVTIGIAKGHSVGTVTTAAFGTALACAVVFTLRQMGWLISELRSTRQGLAAAAVAQERLRFSRDLHDLLGHTLSLVVVKAEAVRRLVERDPAGAAAQARDIEEVGRRALGEVREAAAGYRDAGLGAEIAQARRVLAAAGITLAVRTPTTALPTGVDRLLAWVVREAATNVVRHSGASRCDIDVTADQAMATVDIADDGRAQGPPATPGLGLLGLTERLSAAGGALLAGPAEGGGFRVRATAPLTAAAP